MSTDTMESAIAMDAEAILKIADLQDRDLDDILDGIRHRARSILATLGEGDPSGSAADPCRTEGCDGDAADGEGWNGYCGNCADKLDAEGEERERSLEA